MSDSIAVTLGIGSGIDTKALVASLVDAQFGAKTKALEARKDTLAAQISALSQLRSGLTGFSSALTSLTSSGTLSTQPVSSDSSVLNVALLPGANISGLSASLEVKKLANAQVVTSGSVADATAAFGKGTLTITLGAATYDASDVPTGFTPKSGATPVTVTIGDGQNSLAGIASAINAAKAGVTATVITDSTGSRLSIKGQTGADQAFTIDVAEDASAPGLSALAYNTGAQAMTLTRKSNDALVALDGVDVLRSTNSFSDLIAGVKLDLVKEAPGQVIAINTSPPTAALSQAVNDIVETYNQLINIAKQDTNATSGVLKSDTGAKDLMRQLRELTGQDINSGAADGEPKTLAELGVKTNRDGTLSVDAATLQRALSESGPAVERMLNVGLGSALRQISLSLTGPGGALTSSQSGYSRQQEDIADQELKLQTDSENLTQRLTLQYASMDARVSAYKATQSFLEQQIASWTKSA
ncbi:flagellar filament capping protein FliD [Sphingomonas sp.]|uniref:flagellar filament capping protein FliD n=1 Tax=Sphingomonas sp. TaxID=28214 RepID=UPI002DC04DE0|nr:flagellar filament capping protein FliD [Sphingomonas sp.]HEU4969728.1 flagellar filament capping protein FliD [Sphingomonas sp.]